MADTKQPELTLARFGALVEAFGGDFERFPLHERAQARALALSSRDAQRLLEAARAFDGLLASARDNLPTVALEARLERIPERYAQERPAFRLLPFRSRPQAALAAAAAVVLGLLSGQLATDAGGERSGLDGVEQADIASLTFADDLFDDLTPEPEEGGTE
jgi:hypothetical protein